MIKPSLPLRFGTSGIRGLVAPSEFRLLHPELSEAEIASRFRDEGAMTDRECVLAVRGFLRYLRQLGEIQRGTPVALGVDLRSSSLRIASAALYAIHAEGCQADYVGPVSSPSLLYYAMKNAIPAIMVTGSHIPEDRNGMKFTRARGEILKGEEGEILAQIERLRSSEALTSSSIFTEEDMFQPGIRPVLSDVGHDKVMNLYHRRYSDVFPRDYLAGAKLVFYQHSAVARDVLPAIFSALGATVILIGRCDRFLPVDTEKISEETRRILREAAEIYHPFAILSADGDSDRPLLADETGRILPGDQIGGLAAMALGVRHVAVPDTLNDGVVTLLRERGVEVRLTKVGSPYVVAELQEVGWEANGGFLLGREWLLPPWQSPLAPLPTRDAALPLILVLRLALEENLPLSALIKKYLPPRIHVSVAIDPTMAGFQSYSISKGKLLMERLRPSDPSILEAEFTEGRIWLLHDDQARSLPTPSLEEELLQRKKDLESCFRLVSVWDMPIVRLRWLDGVKITFQHPHHLSQVGDVAHIRASGNAPDLRLIVTSDASPSGEEERANRLARFWPAIAQQLLRQYALL